MTSNLWVSLIIVNFDFDFCMLVDLNCLMHGKELVARAMPSVHKSIDVFFCDNLVIVNLQRRMSTLQNKVSI